MPTGFALLANTWTYVTQKIKGNANLAFNNDNGSGLRVYIIAHQGTDMTSGSGTYDVWSAYSGTFRSGPMTQNWSHTAGATFDVTGLQAEASDEATPFEHRSFGEELSLCQRYYYHTYSYGSPAGTTFNQDYEAPIIIIGTGNYGMGVCNAVYPVEMRAVPTVSFYGSDGTANRIRYWNSGSLSAYGTVNRSTRQILGMSFDAGTNPEDFYSAALVCDAEL